MDDRTHKTFTEIGESSQTNKVPEIAEDIFTTLKKEDKEKYKEAMKEAYEAELKWFNTKPLRLVNKFKEDFQREFSKVFYCRLDSSDLKKEKKDIVLNKQAYILIWDQAYLWGLKPHMGKRTPTEKETSPHFEDFVTKAKEQHRQAHDQDIFNRIIGWHKANDQTYKPKVLITDATDPKKLKEFGDSIALAGAIAGFEKLDNALKRKTKRLHGLVHQAQLRHHQKQIQSFHFDFKKWALDMESQWEHAYKNYVFLENLDSAGKSMVVGLALVLLVTHNITKSARSKEALEYRREKCVYYQNKAFYPEKPDFEIGEREWEREREEIKWQGEWEGEGGKNEMEREEIERQRERERETKLLLSNDFQKKVEMMQSQWDSIYNDFFVGLISEEELNDLQLRGERSLVARLALLFLVSRRLIGGHGEEEKVYRIRKCIQYMRDIFERERHRIEEDREIRRKVEMRRNRDMEGERKERERITKLLGR